MDRWDESIYADDEVEEEVRHGVAAGRRESGCVLQAVAFASGSRGSGWRDPVKITKAGLSTACLRSSHPSHIARVTLLQPLAEPAGARILSSLLFR